MTAMTSRLRRCLAALALLIALPAGAVDRELPPVDEVFVLSAQATAHDRIEVRWQIADGYYLYRHRTAVTAGPGFANAQLMLPEGDKHHDAFFGDVQTYRQHLVGVLTGTPDATASAVKLTVKYQGCADVGVCYPPQTRTLTVALPQATTGAGFSFGKSLSGDPFGLDTLRQRAGAASATPLPPEQAFKSEVIADDGNTLLLRLTPAKGYYLYRDKLTVKLDAGAGLSTTLPPAAQLPKSSPFKDAHFGQVAVYFDQVEIALPVSRRRTDAAKGRLILGLQGCQTDGICYPPMTRTLAVALPAGKLTSASAAAQRETIATPAAAQRDTIATPAAAQRDTIASPAAAQRDTIATPAAAQRDTIPNRGLLASLLLALLGGLILNLMPCVLPVLSLKVLSLAQSGESPQHARRHALTYTAGVLLSMLVLGGVALALRQAGLALGWGFQLQQPLVVAILALAVFGFGLSLSGLWQATIRLGTRSSGLLQGSSRRADFFTGVLAVVLATPCTAPFMGAALVYAFTGPAVGGLLVFLMLGLGLALPFLIIGFVPALARLLPKPGAWMDTFKQLLAFPLYLTAAWLLFVLVALRGAEAAWQWALAAIALSFAAWAWNHARNVGRQRWQAAALLVLLAIGWPLASIYALPKAQAGTAVTSSGVASIAWSEQALADLRAQHRVVFVNMTADWCVSCKANEKTVFERDSFREALQAANAVYMIGDYTNVDPAITAYLQRHHAVGVPLYVVYPRDGSEGRILPVLLTPGIVRDALREAASQ